MNANLKVGDYVKYRDYSTAIGEYSSEYYDIFMTTTLQIKSISYDKISFFEIDEIFNLLNGWGRCPFEKDIHYTRKKKIEKLLENEKI